MTSDTSTVHFSDQQTPSDRAPSGAQAFGEGQTKFTTGWVAGNDVRLLENGEAYYPRVFEAIARARREIRLETFILFEDKVGKELHRLLLEAAGRGVEVDVLIDGWGSPDLSEAFVKAWVDAGIRLHVYDPAKRLFNTRINLFRRMHRKIVVIDGEIAFIGGINFAEDHLRSHGPMAKQDYAVELRGPLVKAVHAFTRANLKPQRVAARWRQWIHRHRQRHPLPLGRLEAGDMSARLVVRDNHMHHTDIEQVYREAIRQARHRIVIANAYFFPGYRLLRDMRKAARRGVDVRLILQGEPDMPIVKTAASLLYRHLARAGVKVFEYCERPLHGKVAVIDDEWATVGSSNMDPTSLALNEEANVVVKSRRFNRVLGERLEHLMTNSCKEVELRKTSRLESAWIQVRSAVVFFALRRFPGLFRAVPASQPTIEHVGPSASVERSGNARIRSSSAHATVAGGAG